MRVASVGHVLFATTMVGVGIMGLVQRHFAPVWSPVSNGVPAREALVYICSLVSLACGTALLWQRTAAPAARVLLACLLLWLVVFRLPYLILTPSLDAFWSAGETAAMLAGAWVLYSWFATEWDRRHAGFIAGDKGLCVARVLFGAALIIFGAGHFIELQHTAELVPGWLPWHVAFAYFTGSAFIAAGVGVITGVYARLAAALVTVEMGAFLVLVWVPILAAGSRGAFDWSETIVTWALVAGAWVVADSYRGTPWLAAWRTRLGSQNHVG